MEINNTSTSVTSPVTGTNNAQAAAVLSSDFETFLQMLTAQARFQDPLEPIDSSEYAAQLAQFSMVEQQVQSNELLTALGAQLGQNNIGQMASWIGMEARTTAPASFGGEPLTVFTSIENGAEEAILISYGQDGSEVQRQQIPTDTSELHWTGIASDGSVLPAGTYSFVVESRIAGQTTSTKNAETYSRITEARSQNGESRFVLKGGSLVTADDVLALREPLQDGGQAFNSL